MTDIYQWIGLGVLFWLQIGVSVMIFRSLGKAFKEDEKVAEENRKCLKELSDELDDLPEYKGLLTDFKNLEMEWINSREALTKLANRLSARKSHIARGHDVPNLSQEELATVAAQRAPISRYERRRQIEREHRAKQEGNTDATS